jgi:hypothetical protein
VVNLLEPAKLLRLYDDGNLTETELQTHLILAATRYPPESIAPLLSAEHLGGLRARSASPPASADEGMWLLGGNWEASFDWEAYCREQRRLWYDGVWRWHRYFQGSS